MQVPAIVSTSQWSPSSVVHEGRLASPMRIMPVRVWWSVYWNSASLNPCPIPHSWSLLSTDPPSSAVSHWNEKVVINGPKDLNEWIGITHLTFDQLMANILKELCCCNYFLIGQWNFSPGTAYPSHAKSLYTARPIISQYMERWSMHNHKVIYP